MLNLYNKYSSVEAVCGWIMALSLEMRLCGLVMCVVCVRFSNNFSFTIYVVTNLSISFAKHYWKWQNTNVKSKAFVADIIKKLSQKAVGCQINEFFGFLCLHHFRNLGEVTHLQKPNYLAFKWNHNKKSLDVSNDLQNFVWATPRLFFGDNCLCNLKRGKPREVHNWIFFPFSIVTSKFRKGR